MNTVKKTDKTAIDIYRLLAALWKKKIMIIAVSVVCAIIVTSGVALTSRPKYQSDILVYVNNTNSSLHSGKQSSVDSSELAAARQLLETYIVALKSRACLDAVIEKANLNYSRGQLKEMLSAQSVNKTEWFKVIVVAKNPDEAQLIANTVADVLPEVLSSAIEGSSVKILDYAVKPQGKVDPGYVLYAECSFIVGFLLSAAVVILKEVFNDKIHDEDTLTEMTDAIPVLANIPHNKSGGSYTKYSYSDGKGGTKKTKKINIRTAICGDLDFAQTEAYNLLQTSIQYSFSDIGSGKIIGITGSERNEGKSTLAINLAYSLSLDKKKVLLLDGDMRLPSVAKKLGIESTPGLSDYLTGKARNSDGIQHSPKAPSLAVICSGVVPPNPFRLLGSESMEKFLNALKEVYDYIIVDLPPVNIVSDPISIAKFLDGFIITTRTEFSTRQGVWDAVKRLQAVNSNILGFVVNEDGKFSISNYGKYGKYGRYGKYGKYSRYGKYGKYEKYGKYTKYAASADSYEKSYENAAKKKNPPNSADL